MSIEFLPDKSSDGNAPPRMTQGRRPKIGASIRDQFADGKWHAVSDIAASIDADVEHVLETLRGMSKNQTYGCMAEKKNSPAGVHYRITKLNRAVPIPVLLERLASAGLRVALAPRLEAGGALTGQATGPVTVTRVP